MKDREKEIKYLMYLKCKLIRDTKKELKALRTELEQLQGKGRVRRNEPR